MSYYLRLEFILDYVDQLCYQTVTRLLVCRFYGRLMLNNPMIIPMMIRTIPTVDYLLLSYMTSRSSGHSSAGLPPVTLFKLSINVFDIFKDLIY